MTNTRKLSLTKNLQNINREQFFFIWLFDCFLLSFKFNEQCMGQGKIIRILLHKTKKNLENVSKEPSNAFVTNIKT